jgi:hypothetical protein
MIQASGCVLKLSGSSKDRKMDTHSSPLEIEESLGPLGFIPSVVYLSQSSSFRGKVQAAPPAFYREFSIT